MCSDRSEASKLDTMLFFWCVGRAREREKMRGEAKGGEESSKGREMGSEYFQLICLFRARVKSAA